MPKLFVWDFHGVLEKGNEYVVIEVTNHVLKEYGINEKLDLELCLELYGKKWHEYFQRLSPGSNEETIKNMVKRGIEISKTADALYKYIKPMDHSHDVLQTIINKGHENLVISNTEPNALEMYINAVKIGQYVRHIIGADSHRKKISKENHKIPLLKEFLISKNYDSIISIGDTETDIELGISVKAITYHFRRDGKNYSEKADYKISDLREVLKQV